MNAARDCCRRCGVDAEYTAPNSPTSLHAPWSASWQFGRGSSAWSTSTTALPCPASADAAAFHAYCAQALIGFTQRDDGGPGGFAHYSSIVVDGFRALLESQKVSFDVGQDAKGPQAQTIIPI
jgi:cold shock protein